MNSASHRANQSRAVFDALIAVLAGALALVVYVRSLAPGLLWGDSAEFQMAAWLGGFAHPTGYPLYLMLGWLWTHLVPLGDPAFRMNLFSALWGGVAVGLFALLVIRLLRFLSGLSLAGRPHPNVSSQMPDWPDRLIALGAALAFTFTPTFWSQAVIAEVYTLHAALVAALLLALLSWAEAAMAGDAARARHRSYLVALLLGLSLAHHRSTILLIPALALFVAVILASTGSRQSVSVRRAGPLLLCLVAPLLLYLYIPLAAPHVSYYRLPLGPNQSLQLYDPTVRGFLAHISGSVFGSSLAAPRLRGLDLGGLLGRFVDELSLNGLLLGGFGLVALILMAVRDRNRRSWAVIALTGVFFITQVAFNLIYAIGDIYVFYIPGYLVWVLWMAIGIWAILLDAVWLFQSAGERARRWAIGVGGVLVAVVLLAFAYRSAVVFWPKVQAATDNSARTEWEALLESELPQDALLVSNDRDEMVPLWYLIHVDGVRPDLAGLFPLIQPAPAWSDVARVADSALQTGRPVVLVKPMPGLELKYDLAPVPGKAAGRLGPPVRVEALPPAAPTHLAQAEYGEKIRLLGYDVNPEPLRAGQPAEVTLYWEPLAEIGEDWTTFVQIVSPGGEKVSQSDHRPGGEFYPTSLWPKGAQLRDVHQFTVAPNATPGTYQIIAGLYVQEDGGLLQLGGPQVVGAVQVSQ